MPYYGSQSNDEFSAGFSHMQNPARANTGSITLGGSSEQSAMGPHAALASTVGGSPDEDGSWQRMQRLSGAYQPGSMPEMTDQLDQGSDDTP